MIWKVVAKQWAYTIGQETNLTDRIRHLILPMTVVVLEHLWYYAYMIRNRLLDETRRNMYYYVRQRECHADRL